MGDLNPQQALAKLAAQIPDSCRENIVIVGSLAAAFQLLNNQKFSVRTKDIDCVIAPRISATTKGAEVAEALLSAGWKPRGEGQHGQPGNAKTPETDLPLVRLYPPDGSEWWVEFLTVPQKEGEQQNEWARLELSAGHFALRAFEFMSLSAFKPARTSLGLLCARPEMMALANMLEHPRVKPAVMSGPIAGRTIKRSNKDLGRVLSIAFLSEEDAIRSWAATWADGLKECFPSRWRALALGAGSGFRELLENPTDLDEAAYTCLQGLLINRNVPISQLLVAGNRVVRTAIEPLEKLANQ